jgi:predicted dehydrogenase
MLDVAIIGAGLMGRHHMAAAQAASGRIVAIVDRNLEAAKRLSRRAPGAMLAADVSALASLSVQVAHICLPTAEHAQAAIAVVEKGASAFVEKPLAGDAGAVQAVFTSAQNAGALVCPVHQYAFQAGVERAIAVLPRLGTLRQIAFEICSAGAENGRIEADKLIEEILPHPISILQRLLPGASVSRTHWSVHSPVAGELAAAASLDGVLVSMRISANARPTRFHTEVLCDRGSIEIDGFHGYAVVLPGAVSRAAKIAGPFSHAFRHLAGAAANLARRALRREFAYPGLRTLTRRFYNAVAQRDLAMCPISPEAAIDGAFVRDAISMDLRKARREAAS